MTGKPLQNFFRQAAIGRDLASENRQQRRLLLGGVEIEHVIARRFLRVGRVALLYQTLDGEETGYWDASQKKWVEDDSYRSAVRRGFAVADKATAPDLLTVPVPAPTAGRS